MDNTSAPDPDSVSLDNSASADPLAAVRFAGFWIRVGASLLDMVVLIPLIVVSFFAQESLVYLLISLVMIAYKPVLEKQYGATVGKMLLGLRVINPSAGPLSWGTAWVRAAFAILAAVPGMLMGVKQRQAGIAPTDFAELAEFQQANSTLQWIGYATGLLWLVSVIAVAFHPRKQGLHDLLADTFVVYKESLPHSRPRT